MYIIGCVIFHPYLYSETAGEILKLFPHSLTVKISLKSFSSFPEVLQFTVQFLQNIKDMGWKEKGKKR